MEPLFGRVLVDWEGCSDKLMVVDYTRLVDVYFCEDALELFFTHFSMASANSCTKFFDLNGARQVRVHLIKFLAKLEELSRVDHLDEDVKTLSSQSVSTMEVNQTVQYSVAQRLSSNCMFIFGEALGEPSVFQALSGRWSFSVPHSEHLLQQAVEFWAGTG